MRAAGLALLVATGGCNWIFGLNTDLRERDASNSDGVDAAWWPMQLTYMVMESPLGPIDYPPIPNATVQVGPIDPADGPLHALPLGTDGSFFVPNDTPKPYRLVYTVEGLPTEIQSSLESGHFVVPMVGRVDRAGAPSHALISFAPVGRTGVVPQARLMTVGLWSTTIFPPGNEQISLPYTYDYQASATSMNGRLGSLEMAHGDLELVMELSNGDVTGYAIASVAQLNPNPPGPAAMANGTWRVAPVENLAWTVPNTPGGPLDPNMRMMSLLIPYNTGNNQATSWGGVVPSEQMPNFLEPVPGGLDGVQLAPLSTGYNLPHQFVNPFAGADGLTLPTAIYTQDTNFRMVGGVRLTSGFQGIHLQNTGAGTPADTRYDVGFAHVSGQDVKLTPAGQPGLELTGSDGLVLKLMGATLVDLTFAADRGVDDCVATLYQLETSSVTPVRRILLQQPPSSTPFRIDASVFAAGKTYVFGVVCRKGQTGVMAGDYTKVAYPYETSTLYTRTFGVTL